MSPITSLLIAALGLVAVTAIGRRSPFLTGIVLATLLALPLIDQLPKVHLTLPAMTAIPAGTSAMTLFPLIYASGVALFGVKFLLDCFSFSRWAGQGTALTEESAPVRASLEEAKQQLSYSGRVEVYTHPTLASPVAGGLLRPAIYLPVEALTWEAATLRAVLLHELGHHVRRDLWTSLGARLACILHWFNPLAWQLRRLHLEQCEYACDAHVLATGLDAKSYAHTLCDLALPRGRRTPALALAMATESSLRSRVENLLAPRRPLTAFPIAATLLLTLGTALAVSTLRPALAKSLSDLDELTSREVKMRLSANPFPGN